MTTKREKKDEPKAAKRPKLKKETLKDLEAKDGEQVRAGAIRVPSDQNTCTCKC